MMKNKERLKMLAIILAVVLVGTGAFSFGLSVIYKEPLELGSCGLCFVLNEEVTNCFGAILYNETNYIKMEYPPVSYGG